MSAYGTIGGHVIWLHQPRTHVEDPVLMFEKRQSWAIDVGEVEINEQKYLIRKFEDKSMQAEILDTWLDANCRFTTEVPSHITRIYARDDGIIHTPGGSINTRGGAVYYIYEDKIYTVRDKTTLVEEKIFHKCARGDSVVMYTNLTPIKGIAVNDEVGIQVIYTDYNHAEYYIEGEYIYNLHYDEDSECIIDGNGLSYNVVQFSGMVDYRLVGAQERQLGWDINCNVARPAGFGKIHVISKNIFIATGETKIDNLIITSDGPDMNCKLCSTTNADNKEIVFGIFTQYVDKKIKIFEHKYLQPKATKAAIRE